MPSTKDSEGQTKVSTVSSMPAATSSKTRQWTNPLMDKNQKLWAKRYRTEIAASTASLCSTVAAFPLDTVKSRMQTHNTGGFNACVRMTYQQEGVNGFYRGVLAPVFSITIVRTISFSIYQKAKYTYDKLIHNATGRSPLQHANAPNAWPNLYTAACFGAAGATSGALVTFISCPFELAKLHSQISVLLEKGNANKMNSFDADHGRSGHTLAELNARKLGTFGTVAKIVKQHGVLGMWSGFHLHMFRDIIGSAVYFSSYESSKQILANARGKSSTSPGPVAVAGAMCGLISWLCIYPIDSAKNMHQRNVFNAPETLPNEEPTKIKKTKANYFSRRMYRGLGVSIARSMLINAVFFSVFEGIKKQVNWLEVEGEEVE